MAQEDHSYPGLAKVTSEEQIEYFVDEKYLDQELLELFKYKEAPGDGTVTLRSTKGSEFEISERSLYRMFERKFVKVNAENLVVHVVEREKFTERLVKEMRAVSIASDIKFPFESALDQTFYMTEKYLFELFHNWFIEVKSADDGRFHVVRKKYLMRKAAELVPDQQPRDVVHRIESVSGDSFAVTDRTLLEKSLEHLEMTLVSEDNVQFKLDKKVAFKFMAIKDFPEGQFDDTSATHLRGTNADVLSIMIRWAVRHLNDPEPKIVYETDEETERTKRIDSVDFWDDDELLMQLPVDQLFRLAHAAGIWQVEGLLKAVIKKTAILFKGKTPAQIRQKLNLGDPLPEDQWRKLH